jgi:hypothetical protein
MSREEGLSGMVRNSDSYCALEKEEREVMKVKRNTSTDDVTVAYRSMNDCMPRGASALYIPMSIIANIKPKSATRKIASTIQPNVFRSTLDEARSFFPGRWMANTDLRFRARSAMNGDEGR